MTDAIPIDTKNYSQTAAEAVRNRRLKTALSGLQQRFGKGAARAYAQMPEGDDLRDRAHDIRMQTVENLDVVLELLAANIRRNGGQVYFAADAAAAVDYCRSLARRHGVRRVVKGKSMVSEEIGFNTALAADGIEVTESDLGEFIIQLAGEHPSHIIAPAIHKSRQQIGRLFSDRLGIAYTDDAPRLTQAARKALRAKFLAADMGVSGCNLACAETGHITTVSNEGNIRMSTTLPKIHVALMGMERVAARLQDHNTLLRLLTRGASAQQMAVYMSYIGGPRAAGQVDGPQEFHLVIIDNGRSKILADDRFREILCCIRCAACLNACPVYRHIGGHAYGFAYCGPVGAIVTPLLTDVARARDLFQGETLCGACQEICSVKIDLPRMLRELRTIVAEGDAYWNLRPQRGIEAAIFAGWGKLVGHRGAYETGLRLAAAGQHLMPQANGMIRKLPPPLDGWTQGRDLQPLAKTPFLTRKRREGN